MLTPPRDSTLQTLQDGLVAAILPTLNVLLHGCIQSYRAKRPALWRRRSPSACDSPAQELHGPQSQTPKKPGYALDQNPPPVNQETLLTLEDDEPPFDTLLAHWGLSAHSVRVSCVGEPASSLTL